MNEESQNLADAYHLPLLSLSLSLWLIFFAPVSYSPLSGVWREGGKGGGGRGKKSCYEWRRGPGTKGCRKPLEIGKGKKTDSPVESPEGMQPYRPILNISRTLR